MGKLLYIGFFFIAPLFCAAQTATGSWYGKADVEMAGIHNNYLTELVLKQKGNRVEGIFGYYFRDKYQSSFVHGTYNPKTREVIILNIPVIYFASNSTVNSIDCNTNFRGLLRTSKVGSSLSGYFYHDERYKYMCPDLKVTYALDKTDNQHDSISAITAAATKIWKPQEDDYVVNVAAAAPVATPPSAGQSVTPPPAATSVNRVIDSPKAAIVRPDNPRPVRDSAIVPLPPPPPPKPDSVKIAASFTKRKAVLNTEVEVESDSIRLSFYDNGEIDGDSISVFVNNQVVLTHQELAAKAFNLYLHLDSTRDVNEISMFAENLGKLPPNTALMVITDGKNRYEVFMSSSLTENATIRLRRKKTP